MASRQREEISSCNYPLIASEYPVAIHLAAAKLSSVINTGWSEFPAQNMSNWFFPNTLSSLGRVRSLLPVKINVRSVSVRSCSYCTLFAVLLTGQSVKGGGPELVIFS